MGVEGFRKASLAQTFAFGRGGAFFLFFWAAVLFGCPYLLLKDGATARPINTGAYILAHQEIPRHFFTWAVNPQWPWLTHELGADLSFGYLFDGFGLNGVVFLGSGLIVLSLMWSYQIARQRGLGAISGWVPLALMLLAASMHWSARPHLFSWVAFLALHYVTFLSAAGWKLRALLTACIAFAWVNFHGSALLALPITLVRPAVELFSSLGSRGKRRSEAQSIGMILADLVPVFAAALAICLNIRGYHFYSYMLHYATHPDVLGKGSEWTAFDPAFGISSWAVIALTLLFVALCLSARYRPPAWELLLLLLLLASGLKAMRMVPYLALVLLPACGPPSAILRRRLLDTTLPSAGGGLLNQLICGFSSFARIEERLSQGVPLRRIVLMLLLASLMVAIFLLHPAYKVKDFYERTIPVKAARSIPEAVDDRQLFNWDNWGQYLYLVRGKPVFIDDNTDFYPRKFFLEYLATLHAKPGWQGRLDRWGINYVLVPNGIDLDKALSNDGAWLPVKRDLAGVLYRRR